MLMKNIDFFIFRAGEDIFFIGWSFPGAFDLFDFLD